jgi:hypothetical protein
MAAAAHFANFDGNGYYGSNENSTTSYSAESYRTKVQPETSHR